MSTFTAIRIYAGLCLYRLAFAIKGGVAAKPVKAGASPSVSRVTSERG